MTTLHIYKLIDSNKAITTEAGDLVFREIISEFEKGNKVILDYHDVTFIISAFQNAAIGQLFSRYDQTYISNNLQIENLTEKNREVLKLVIDAAVRYFEDRKKFEDNIKDELPNE
jgi:hypothetical protein